VRGAAHKVASAVSAFLRSPLADKPFARSGGATILHHEAHPPTWYSLAMVAAMPMLRRERAAFTERLGQYLSTHAPKRAFVIQVGKKSLNPLISCWEIRRRRMQRQRPDVPFALAFYEQMARIGALAASPLATRCWQAGIECDDRRVEAQEAGRRPKTTHAATYHAYPLTSDEKSTRLVDVTFRWRYRQGGGGR
jgi:hypothetical protein